MFSKVYYIFSTCILLTFLIADILEPSSFSRTSFCCSNIYPLFFEEELLYKSVNSDSLHAHPKHTHNLPHFGYKCRERTCLSFYRFSSFKLSQPHIIPILGFLLLHPAQIKKKRAIVYALVPLHVQIGLK